MTIAFLLSVAAVVLLLGGKRRRAGLFTFASLACSAAFITWVQLSPPIG